MFFHFQQARPATLAIITSLTILLFLSCSDHKQKMYQSELDKVKKEAQEALSSNIKEFNLYEHRPQSDGLYTDSNNLEFITNNIPYFKCSNDTLSKVYNYRWWMISKHLRDYYDSMDNRNYWVITEFFGYPAWGTLSGAITCPIGHQFYDVRWLHDPQYLQSYAEYLTAGSPSKLSQRKNGNFLTHLERPESVHFSSWTIDGVEAFLKIHPNDAWRQKCFRSSNHTNILLIVCSL